MPMKEIFQPFWWFIGMLSCTAIFELLHGAFKRELNNLFKRWDISHHDVITSEHSATLYWDLVDFIKELMKKSLNISTFFSAVIMIIALMFKAPTSAAIFSFFLGIITYRFAIFNNWLGMKKYGDDKRPGRDTNNIGE